MDFRTSRKPPDKNSVLQVEMPGRTPARSLGCPRGLEWNGCQLLIGCASGFHGCAPSLTPPTFSLRKEVIQPQVLLRLPCYDFTPIMSHTLGRCLPLAGVSLQTSSTTHFRDVTGGVYKARERIHRSVLICDY